MANRFQTWTQKAFDRMKRLRDFRVSPAQFKALTQWMQASEQKARLPFLISASALVMGTYFAADLTALLAEMLLPEAPIAPVSLNRGSPYGSSSARPRQLEEYSVISSRNLFNSRGLIPGEEITPTGDPGGAPVRTTLPLALIGTLILKNELKSIATIEDRAASLVLPLRVQDEIPGKIRILNIEPRRVVFLNLGSSRREFVDLPEDTGASPRISLGSPRVSAAAPSAGIEQNSPTNFTIDRGEIDRAMSDLNAILTQARAVPNFENGMPAGYKLFQIVPGSIYEKLGLRNGDTISGLNGETVNDPGKAFETLSALKTMKHLELQIKRDGKVSNFSYDIRN